MHCNLTKLKENNKIEKVKNIFNIYRALKTNKENMNPCANNGT